MSCPQCDAGAAVGASRCMSCGFVFFERRPRLSLPRPSLLSVVLALLVVAAGTAVALLLTRDHPATPLGPVPAARAESRLEHQLGAGGGPPGSVRCAGSIRRRHFTRCHFRYADGDTQLMLVTVTADGTLDIDVPYPAQRRPGG
jgi:hypothetical protein